jgi:hypothetical protein
MSVYLYGFQPTGNKTPFHLPDGKVGPTIEIFNLTFRTGNFGSWGNEKYEKAIFTKLELAWGEKELPEFFVIGKREKWATVYRTEKPLFHAEWIDTNPLPGKAKPIGYLTKIGGRFRVIPESESERKGRKEEE